MSELKKQTVSGIKWILSSSFLNKGLSVATTVVLARILDPSDFGLCALAFIVINAFGLFKSMGFDSALIQRNDNIEKAASTAFFVIPLTGLVLYLILFFSAPIIGKLLNNQDVVNVVKILGLIFLFGNIGKVPFVLLEKNMKFKKLAFIEVIGTLIFSFFSIYCATKGFKVWSLVIAYIAKTFTENISFWILAKWTPEFEFDKKVFLEMFHFGKFLLLGGIVWFLKMTLDNLLVGRILGVAALGLYAIAFNIANFGADYFANKVYRVIFPAFSKIQTDKDNMKQAFLKITKLTSIFALPFCVVLFLFADGLITIIYGPKWTPAIPALRVLAFAGLLNTLPLAMGPLFNASGHSKAIFWYSAIQVVLFLGFITPAAKNYGLVGVSLVVALSQLIAIISYLPFTMKIISLRIKELFINLRTCIIASLIMFTLGSVLQNTLTTQVNFYYTFIIKLVLTIGIYIFSIFILEKKILKEIKELICL